MGCRCLENSKILVPQSSSCLSVSRAAPEYLTQVVHDGVMGDVAAHPRDSGAQMLTASEAAAQLGVKLGTLYAYVSRGWLKSYRRKVGRQALYRRSDIEALRGIIAPERGVRARSLPDASSWVT